MELTSEERALLRGDGTGAQQVAMRTVVAVAEAEGAESLVEIERAHIDGCLYHGPSGIDFARLLVDGGGRIAVPTTLNVSSLDMLHPHLFRGDPAVAEASRQLTDAYLALGCEPTWTCAPYQLPDRPHFGQQVAWGESNAIVFANSVLGARTNRYGDFMDICCAITGRAPHTGLHTDAGRAASVRIDLDVPDHVLSSDLLYPLLGYAIGCLVGTRIPVIVGLDQRAGEDRLKSLGAAAASSGAVAMFHAVGVTPEAPDLETALAGRRPIAVKRIGVPELTETRWRLGHRQGPLGAVSVGTPHMSLTELRDLAGMTEGSESLVPFYLNTARGTLQAAEREGIVWSLTRFGATIVTDTCTYITPIIGEVTGTVMTNSAKWAHYAPSNLGVDVAFGSLAECVASAVEGSMVLSDDWA